CTRQGYDSDVISGGWVQRGRYGKNAWQMALGDRVTFILRGRLQEARRP
ncbi:polyisoprenoid-binding protein, partial [Xanthomonas perforans]|nr:polyisoprenoid-binding protein [Xanthomonas perforans]